MKPGSGASANRGAGVVLERSVAVAEVSPLSIEPEVLGKPLLASRNDDRKLDLRRGHGVGQQQTQRSDLVVR
jgi:hypothetical protein